MNGQIAEALAQLYSQIFGETCAGLFDATLSQFTFTANGEFGIISFHISSADVERLNIYRLLTIMRNKYNEKYWEKRY